MREASRGAPVRALADGRVGAVGQARKRACWLCRPRCRCTLCRDLCPSRCRQGAVRRTQFMTLTRHKSPVTLTRQDTFNSWPRATPGIAALFFARWRGRMLRGLRGWCVGEDARLQKEFITLYSLPSTIRPVGRNQPSACGRKSTKHAAKQGRGSKNIYICSAKRGAHALHVPPARPCCNGGGPQQRRSD